MIEYQTIFTQVQARGHAHDGVAMDRGTWPREGKPFFNHWLGVIGNAQIGPFYLGTLGLASLVSGGLAIFIIGMNYLASVNWNPIRWCVSCSGCRSIRRHRNMVSPSRL